MYICVPYIHTSFWLLLLQVKWLPTEDRGPNGAVGKGTFDPSFAVALIVTVYGVSTFQYTHVHVQRIR